MFFITHSLLFIATLIYKPVTEVFLRFGFDNLNFTLSLKDLNRFCVPEDPKIFSLLNHSLCTLFASVNASLQALLFLYSFFLPNPDCTVATIRSLRSCYGNWESAALVESPWQWGIHSVLHGFHSDWVSREPTGTVDGGEGRESGKGCLQSQDCHSTPLYDQPRKNCWQAVWEYSWIKVSVDGEALQKSNVIP